MTGIVDRRGRVLIASLVALTLAGCGGSPSPLKAGGPHDGVMIKLPESKGFAELKLESLTKPAPRKAPVEIALYFVGTDKATPLNPLPSEVEINVIDPETRQKTLYKFTPSPKEGDPVGAARFVSGPIERDYGQVAIAGELRANLNGPVTVNF